MTYRIRPGGALKLGLTGETARILQRVAVVLSTPLGSVPMYREFGLDMSFLDKPEPVAEVMMVAPVREAVERWVPEVRVLSVTRDRSEPGRLTPVVEVELTQ